jgi:hypothetical protein
VQTVESEENAKEKECCEDDSARSDDSPTLEKDHQTWSPSHSHDAQHLNFVNQCQADDRRCGDRGVVQGSTAEFADLTGRDGT